MQSASVVATKIAGRYTTSSLLGTGGMAAVYRAHDESLNRTVALKRLTGSDEAAAVLFEEEFHTLAGLRHPSIIEVFDYGLDAEGPFYTMELLEGQDAAKLAPLPWRAVCECLRDVGSALSLVHRRELVHRDISPRNVWRVANGGFKVIDFGGLARFGIPENIVGTPACMAPESVTGSPLDQRADLYSLGTVAYFLLTGRHATTARKIEDLFLPQPRPLPPSALLRMADQGDDRDPIPPALDELILSLLSRAPLARPSSAAEVIERASAIAGLPVDGHARSLQPNLISTQFVGREHQAKLLGDAVVLLQEGNGGTVLCESPPGRGKTRLLKEMMLDARLAGVAVLHTEARLHPETYGAAIHLAEALLDSLPEIAREQAAPHAGQLARLSGKLGARLAFSVPPSPVPAAPGEARMRLQDALLGWFLAVSGRKKLAVIVDDVDELDESSLAFLVALARESRRHPVLVVASRTEESGRPASDLEKALRTVARVLPLPALTLDSTRALLRSAFGDVPNLPRLADKLHERSGGNPQHCLDLVSHLLHQDVLHHQGGAWSLPLELRDEQLPDTFDAVLARRFEGLGRSAKLLAQVLHLHGGMLSVATCSELLDDESDGSVSVAFDELLREGVATGSRSGARIAVRYVRHVGVMDPARAKKLHRTLAESRLSGSALSAADRLEAGLHLLRAEEDERAGEQVARGAIGIITEPDSLRGAVPTLEAILKIYKEGNRRAEEVAPLLGALTSAAYYADHRLARRYGDEALEVLRGVVGLERAARWRPYVGKKLSLFVGLIGAGIKLRRLAKTRRTPSLREALLLLFTTVSTLTGVHVIYIDRANALRYAASLEHLTALGKDHVASFMYDFSRALVMTIENASGKARARWHRMLERLRDGRPIRGLPEQTRQLYFGGALYACGVLESWTDGDGALRIADELDAAGLKLYEMSADQVRALYYANQGNKERSEYYTSRVETHAIQRGTAWQVEIWSQGALIGTHLRCHDAMGMKHTCDVLERLSREIASLSLYGRRARGAYAVMRGRYEEAVSILEAADAGEYKHVVGAQRGIGLLARAYNLWGNPARAKELCQAAVRAMDEGDRELVAMSQIVFVELALAEARLGNFDEAERSIEAMLAKHLPLGGPLTLGALYEARAAVALLRERRDDARRYLEEMSRWYAKTGLASLAARAELHFANLDRRDGILAIPAAEIPIDDASETVLFASDGSDIESTQVATKVD
jgi:tetratricopeptide (TPR) repeat protein